MGSGFRAEVGGSGFRAEVGVYPRKRNAVGNPCQPIDRLVMGCAEEETAGRGTHREKMSICRESGKPRFHVGSVAVGYFLGLGRPGEFPQVPR
jgi:hypothetical protein